MVLEAAGYTCWMAPDDIVGTESWPDQILAAIASSKAMLILVSSASNKSPHVSREVNLALGEGRPVLPIRIEDVAPGGSLKYLLSLVQRVDAFPPPVDLHRDRILRQLDSVVPRPGSAVTTAPPVAAPAPKPAPPPPAALPDLAGPIGNRFFIPAKDGKPGFSIPWPPPRAAPRKRSGPPMALLVGGAVVALVIAGVIGANLLGGPGASPKPSDAAVATATAPTEETTNGPVTVAPLSDAELQLQAALPALAGFDACTEWRTPPGGADVLSPSGYAASTARLSCPGPTADAPRAEFAVYSTADALKADYDSIMAELGVAAGGACVSKIPANAPWSFPTHENSGDLACFERDGAVQYVWTQKQLRVLGQWLAPDNPTGFAYWQSWSQTFNAAEASLLADVPESADDLGPCVRAADRYYETALAIIACPQPAKQNPVFYARFASGDAFPDDPMTTMFDSILGAAGFVEDSTDFCYSDPPAFGRHTWGYVIEGQVGDAEGYLGCYERTDNTPATAQYVWSLNRTAVMGLWNAPNLASGIAFFDGWIGEVQAR